MSLVSDAVRQSPARGALSVRLSPYVVFVGTSVLCFLRLPSAARQTLWAEDGTRFTSDAVNAGARAVFDPFGGYLHVVSRLLAWFTTSLVSFPRYALVLNALACLVTGVVAAVVFSASAFAIRSPWLRAWLAVLTVLLPVVGQEVVGSVANLHWFFLWGAFWVLLNRPASRGGAVAATGFLLAATLSEIQTALLLPVAVLVGVRAVRRGEGVPARLVAFGLGLSAQLVATLAVPRVNHRAWVGVVNLAQDAARQVLMPLWSGNELVLRSWLSGGGWWPAVACGLPVLFAGGYLAARAGRASRLLAAALLLLALVAFTTAVSLNATREVALAKGGSVSQEVFLSRYGVVPQLALLAVVALAAQVALDRRDRVVAAASGVLLVALLVPGLLSFHVPTNRRDPANDWPSQSASAARTCRADGAPSVALQVSPDRRWKLTVPCRRVVTTHGWTMWPGHG